MLMPELGRLAIGRFTSLTSLRLRMVVGLQPATLQALHSSGLQQISLWNCKEAGLALFAPGSIINPLTNLQQVYFSEAYHDLEACCATLIEAEAEGQQLVQRLSETASFIQSLPSLELVSGRSKIFLGFREGFNGWEREPARGVRQYHSCSRSVCLAASQTWRKKERPA